jgi:hypothetical protein
MIRKVRRRRKDLSVGCLFVEQASLHASGGARNRLRLINRGQQLGEHRATQRGWRNTTQKTHTVRD